jgi:hypothetical protein
MVARVLGMCKLDLEGMQEVSWEKGGTEWTEDYTFSMEKGVKIIGWGQVFFCSSPSFIIYLSSIRSVETCYGCYKTESFHLFKGLLIRGSYQQLEELSSLVVVSYIILRGRWCNIIFLNVHAP